MIIAYIYDQTVDGAFVFFFLSFAIEKYTKRKFTIITLFYRHCKIQNPLKKWTQEKMC